MLKIWVLAVGLVVAIPLILLAVFVGWAVAKTRGMRIRTRR
jgi:hypothetical protein